MLLHKTKEIHGNSFRRKMQAVAEGLPYDDSVKCLQETLDLTQGELAELSGIPVRTLIRRKQEGKLHGGPESERVERLERIVRMALELFEGDRNEALQWLRSPVPALEDQIPLEIAKSEIGAREVEKVINRLEHGVF